MRLDFFQRRKLMNYADALITETNRGAAMTANGALSYGSTKSNVLDFFSKSGALRGNASEALRYFSKAMSEDSTLALKSLFYMRDVRGGQGERDNFRSILVYLAGKYPSEISRNMKYIPEFGRWDDLYSFMGTKLQDLALDIMKDQFMADVRVLNDGVGNVSLLAKWLKSTNTSSKESNRIGILTQNYFGLTPRKYRKALSALRKSISLVETTMSQNKWSDVAYSRVPSQASRIYSKAFRKHDPIGYGVFMDKVKTGETKINAGTLYPYDIVKKVKSMEYSSDEIETYDALWNALPNYMTEQENVLAVIDTSGSMNHGNGSVIPMDVSVSVGMYLAERTSGPFKNMFITFSEKPEMQKIVGKDIHEKVRNVSNASWGANTNLQAVFDLILSTAKKYNVTQDELPKKLFIISDMQFDACDGNRHTNLETINNKFKAFGYERPQIVFWNVNASSDTPSTMDENGTFLVSGCSPSILKHAINCEATNPYELMLEVLNSERYIKIS